MTRLDALKGLAAKVEAGTARASDFNIFVSPYDYGSVVTRNYAWQSCSGSIYAARAFHEDLLPNWEAWLQHGLGVSVKAPGKRVWGDPVWINECFARSWLLCVLRARIAKEEAQ